MTLSIGQLKFNNMRTMVLAITLVSTSPNSRAVGLFRLWLFPLLNVETATNGAHMKWDLWPTPYYICYQVCGQLFYTDTKISEGAISVPVVCT